MWRVWGRTAHPRVRGAGAEILRADHLSNGTPPRPRGKPFSPSQDAVVMRYTPAGAGQMKMPPLHLLNPRVHPRVRGGKRAYDDGVVLLSAHTR